MAKVCNYWVGTCGDADGLNRKTIDLLPQEEEGQVPRTVRQNSLIEAYRKLFTDRTICGAPNAHGPWIKEHVKF